MDAPVLVPQGILRRLKVIRRIGGAGGNNGSSCSSDSPLSFIGPLHDSESTGFLKSPSMARRRLMHCRGNRTSQTHHGFVGFPSNFVDTRCDGADMGHLRLSQGTIHRLGATPRLHAKPLRLGLSRDCYLSVSRLVLLPIRRSDGLKPEVTGSGRISHSAVWVCSVEDEFRWERELDARVEDHFLNEVDTSRFILAKSYIIFSKPFILDCMTICFLPKFLICEKAKRSLREERLKTLMSGRLRHV